MAGPQFHRLVFSDEFAGPAGTPPPANQWTHDVGAYGSPDHELETYTASAANASLNGAGDLAIVARRQTRTGPDGLTRHYTSARLDTLGRFSARYGRIEARMRLPAGAGLWSAFWMMGDDITTIGWPKCGEIDVAEAKGQHPSAVRATLHGPNGDATGFSLGENFDAARSLTDSFHTYAISWSPGSITWLLDGLPYRVISASDLGPGDRWVFDRPFSVLLNLAVGGRYPGPPDAATHFPATLLVDWVRVYE